MTTTMLIRTLTIFIVYLLHALIDCFVNTSGLYVTNQDTKLVICEYMIELYDCKPRFRAV